jgi:small subunit ribosomal protein S4
MPKRKRKKYSRPHKPFDKARIEEENLLVEKYGLKNKKEIWKAEASIRKMRNQAKELITKPKEEKELFIKKLQKKGFKVENIADALALNKEDWLKRRLQTVVFTKGLVNTPKQARQLITHKHVSVNGHAVNIPSYQVELNEEPNVELKIALSLEKKKEKSDIEKIKEEIMGASEPNILQEAGEL